MTKNEYIKKELYDFGILIIDSPEDEDIVLFANMRDGLKIMHEMTREDFDELTREDMREILL